MYTFTVWKQILKLRWAENIIADYDKLNISKECFYREMFPTIDFFPLSDLCYSSFSKNENFL